MYSRLTGNWQSLIQISPRLSELFTSDYDTSIDARFLTNLPTYFSFPNLHHTLIPSYGSLILCVSLVAASHFPKQDRTRACTKRPV